MTAAPTTPPDVPVLQAALEAHDAGLCVVPVRTDGTKHPVGTWKHWQTKRPTRDRVTQWFRDGHPGIGVVCGQVSGGLELLEIEGWAVRQGAWEEFVQACDDAGLTELLDRIIDGYAEKSPSDGNHLLYRCPEAGEGNRKLARRRNPDDPTKIDTKIETRGEGGYVVVAPSHGPVHESGQPWELISGSFATIATITPAERAALFDVCRSFDEVGDEERTPTIIPATQNNIRLAPISTDAESWMDQVVQELARRSWADVLGQYGWTHAGRTGDIDYWRRPGKEVGQSASTNAKGTDRLIVFSSSTPFVEWDGRGMAPSYDRLDVIATYSHQGDRVAAARALAGRDTPIRLTTQPRATQAPRNVDPETGEILAPEVGTLLPDEFWEARPVFEHIRTAARSRLIAPDALFGAVLAKVALLTDHRFVLPPIVGRYGTLDFLLGLSGKSGSGKGSTLDTSNELLAVGIATANDYRTTTAPVGSGEGMVHAYHEPSTETVDGKKKTVYRRRWEGILFRIDEGQALGALAQRSGQTTMTTLRSAWSGETLGGSYAGADKKVTLAAGSYRFVGVMAIQPALGRDILADHIGGTPQRFVWLSMMDPNVPDDTPEWPGPLVWSPPVWTSSDATPAMNNRMATVLHVAQVIRDDLRAERKERLRSGGTDDDHSALRRLKVSALLALLDERLEVTADDWRLAGIVSDTSRAAVEAMRAAIDEEFERTMARDVTLAGRRARAAELARASVANETERVARMVGRHVHKHSGETGQPCSRKCARHAVRSDLRDVMPDGLARAIALGWVVEGDDDALTPGESRPA